MSFPNRGEGGGVPHLGRIPTFSRCFFLATSLRTISSSELRVKTNPFEVLMKHHEDILEGSGLGDQVYLG